MNLIKNNFKKGVSIVETVIYVAIFTVMSIVVINSFLVIISSLSVIRMNHELLDSGSISMERISREIRNAKNIDLVNTPSNGTVLQIKNTDNIYIKFSKDGDNLNLYEGGTLVDNLLTENIKLNSISFTPISTTSSEGVKIQMTLEYSRGRLNKIENFYDTVVLRGGY